jgi:hypothetical protein
LSDDSKDLGAFEALGTVDPVTQCNSPKDFEIFNNIAVRASDLARLFKLF